MEWDYTDEAAVTIDGVSKEEVYKAIDNNENTSLKVNADDLEMIIKIVDTASPNIAVTGALVTPGDENTGDVTSWSVQASYVVFQFQITSTNLDYYFINFIYRLSLTINQKLT